LIFECFSKNLLKQFKFNWNQTRITDTLHEDPYTFLIVSRSFLLRVRNVSDKVVEKIKTFILILVTFFENPAVYGTMWKDTVQPGRSQIIIWCMRIECCILKAKNVIWESVIGFSLPLQQWLLGRTSRLRYTNTYIASFVMPWNCVELKLRFRFRYIYVFIYR
jgi:hypothetical protein